MHGLVWWCMGAVIFEAKLRQPLIASDIEHGRGTKGEGVAIVESR